MSELDMSRPGSELFPEAQPSNYNSYQDVNTDQVVNDPLNQGVTNDAADHASDKDYNFQALRGEVAKMKEEREYWRGQAEARTSQQREPEPQADAFAALDLEDTNDVRKAFDVIRQQNESMRSELKDAITALSTKTQHSDWNQLVTQHVPQLTQKNPIFAEMIKNASNPYEAAYLLAELNARGQPVQQPSSDGQRAMNNAQKPQTLASVGGRGQLSAADYYANMSDKDFHELAAKNLANV